MLSSAVQGTRTQVDLQESWLRQKAMCDVWKEDSSAARTCTAWLCAESEHSSKLTALRYILGEYARIECKVFTRLVFL